MEGCMDSNVLRNPTCPSCQAEAEPAATECTRCGVIFAKYKPLARGPRPLDPEEERSAAATVPSVWAHVRAMTADAAFAVEGPVNPFTWFGHAAVLVGLAGWSWPLMTAGIASNYAGESFLHLINLPFHEAGHIFFTPLGRFMQVLGGSLGQLLMPLVCLVAFLFQQRNPFGAAVTLWWTGESLLDLAPYINDARALELILIGGVTGKDVEDYHDWEYILRTLGWLPYDHTLARIAHGLGSVVMVVALLWAGSLLRQQYRRME